MTDPAYPHRLELGWMRELRHIAGLGGQVDADYFGYFDRRDMPIRDELTTPGYVEPFEGGYRLTEAGWAWCRENGAA
jgi:hypothetical protein